MREAAPGNSEVEGEGVVGTVPLAVGRGTAETEDEAAVVAGTSYEEGAALEAAGAEVGAALDSGASEEAGADEAGAEEAPGWGTSMGTPALAQVDSTPEMTSACSSAEQAPWTQGVTLAKRESDFWQWHLKSVRSEQPSLPNAVKKH